MTSARSVRFAREDVPLLAAVDVVVAGGSCCGVACAERLARADQRVLLVEPRTYLGHDLAATLRPWLPGSDTALAAVPILAAFLARQGAPTVANERPFSLHALKLYLEERLLAAGVELLYASGVMGFVLAGPPEAGGSEPLHVRPWPGDSDALVDGSLRGLVVGNKSGRQFIACRQLLAGSTAELAPLQAAMLPPGALPRAEVVAFARTLEFDGVAPLEGTSLAVPAALEMAGDRVWLHRGYRGAGHLYIECIMALESVGHEAASDSAREGAARRRSMEVAAYLLQNVAAFDGATLAAASHELFAYPPATERGSDVQHAAGWAPLPVASDLLIMEPESPQPGKQVERALLEAWSLPVISEVDVLVAGGGTSGATAARVAGEAGLRTAVVEMNPGLGGTGTYGGVHSYWFGRRVGFAAQVTEMAIDLHHKLRQPPPEGAVPRWNIEAKAQALRQAVEEAGAELVLNAIVVGAVVQAGSKRPGQRRTVAGVALVTRRGPAVILAKVVIDASGDGDVAAYAGAQITYGAARDHVVMWYSLAQFARPGRTRNNFTSMVDVSNVRDYTRALLAGRRRLRDNDHDHGIYVATRESRHVLGEVQLTLSDQLLQRRWPDVVNIAFSNHDVKGHSASDWVQIGLIPPNLDVEIPYRALLPQGLDNILVVGKAISATHDALPAIRMQADMENLGGAAALAAALACRRRVTVRQIDVKALQRALVDAGVLPAAIIGRELAPWRLEGQRLAQAIAGLDAHPLIQYADMEMDEVYRERLPPVEICCAGPEAVPLLEQALAAEQDEQRRLLLAQLLALVGSSAGAPVLEEALWAALSGEALPQRDSHIRYAGAPPDQGAMPQEVYWLHALARTRQHTALGIWQRVVHLLQTTTAADVASGVKGAFYYVQAVCAGAERLGSPEALPLLARLHSYEPFHNLVCRAGYEVDFFAERRAYLELLIARAMARCGSMQGAAILVNYLDDVRALLAAHAHSELLAISGQRLGRDSAAWAQWLEEQGERLPPRPYAPISAPMRMWREEVLVEVSAETGKEDDV